MVSLLKSAGARIAPERLWVNPDCGCKTRDWGEVRPAIANMVAAAGVLRGEAVYKQGWGRNSPGPIFFLINSVAPSELTYPGGQSGLRRS
jgi:hypothetical protein